MNRYERLVLSTVKRLGDIIMNDDSQDIGRFDHLHHWFIGACMKYGVDVYQALSILGDAGKALMEFQKLKER